MKVFKKTYTCYQDPDGKRCNKDRAVIAGPGGSDRIRPGFRRIVRKTGGYYGTVPGPGVRSSTVALARDKQVAQQKLAKLIAAAEREQNGLGDPFAKHNDTSLDEH